ncbi:MAG: T9SS type A sorting domain-containing protein, partial [Bacteroidia bacterium]
AFTTGVGSVTNRDRRKPLQELNRMISRELGINKGELKDTTIWVKVFNPDPLTTAKRQYGSNYRNFKDSNNSYLNQQMQWKSIDAEVRSDTFWLSSKWVKLLYNGKEPITSINSDSIEVTRDHWQFEYLMIYYHLKKYRDFLESIGFEQMANYPVKANPHAYTYDNSKFIPRLDGSGSGLLNFGYCKDSCGTSIANECHVDDAEDADVIIHEYGHALSFSVNGNETSRTPRKAIDEGLSDFITCAYSKKIGEFESDYIFNWDGRNEFWDGRKCFTSRTVNDYKTGRYVEHYNGEIFAGALSEIALKIGYDETHKILFESMYSYSERMKFTDAALLFLDAEQRVYKAENAQTVCSIFAKYNFVSDSFCMVSMADKPNTKFYAINKRAFFENGSIVLQLNTPYITRLKLYDATGKLAYSSELNNQATIIESLQLAKGTYVLVLENQSRIFTEKMVR